MLNHTFGPYAAIDRLGRKLPLPEKVGTLRENRYVGMFYFINLTWKKGMRPLKDNSKIWRETPEAFMDVSHPVWETDGCYWGEPLFGYYEHGRRVGYSPSCHDADHGGCGFYPVRYDQPDHA